MDAEPSAQLSRGFIQQEQVFQPGLRTHLSDAIAAPVIDLDVGLGAGAMAIQIPVQMFPIETVGHAVVAGFDRAIADVFAEHLAVLGFYQTVIAALSGAVFCLFDEQFFEQSGDPFVDELRVVVRVKTHDAKGSWSIMDFITLLSNRISWLGSTNRPIIPGLNFSVSCMPMFTSPHDYLRAHLGLDRSTT